ncbi:MAG: hypothetical protein JXA37_07920 [Chloroflexia bacterium]|nr:hypothetical protein [Chloroflexia bacterium]
MRGKHIWIIVGILGALLLVVAFWWLDFRLARSTTRSELHLSAYRSGDALPAEMVAGSPLDYAVVDSGPLARTLRGELLDELEVDPAFSRVSSVPPVDYSPHPFAWIEAELLQEIWTPFYAAARVSVTLAYASNGDLAWRDDPVVRFESSEGPIVRIRATFVFENSAWGLLSVDGYRTLLAEQMAGETHQLLRDLLLQPERFGWTR